MRCIFVLLVLTVTLATGQRSGTRGGRSRGKDDEKVHNLPPLPKKGEQDDFYKVLGVSEKANDREIKRQYRKLALRWHPDKVEPKERDKAVKNFARISKAYQTISDEKARREYDLSRSDPFRRAHGDGGGGGGGGPRGFDFGFNGGGSPFEARAGSGRGAKPSFSFSFGGPDGGAGGGDGGGSPFEIGRASCRERV
eukprot:TRINITY_DN1022_c0_g1_i1.p1 TRINITY_DN1022_c0_g1~~TRINITY_DN1022_c0_g1_i1.p1  ORF type:complete len:196 (+),score=10.05 TRINITY_DN1022_c0_g1_i1:272-859(+)